MKIRTVFFSNYIDCGFAFKTAHYYYSLNQKIKTDKLKKFVCFKNTIPTYLMISNPPIPGSFFISPLAA